MAPIQLHIAPLENVYGWYKKFMPNAKRQPANIENPQITEIKIVNLRP